MRMTRFVVDWLGYVLFMHAPAALLLKFPTIGLWILSRAGRFAFGDSTGTPHKRHTTRASH